MRWPRLTYPQRMQVALWLLPFLPSLALLFVPRIAGGDVFGKGDEKEARRQEDLAKQQESVTNIGNQFLAQLIPGSQEYNEFQSEALRLAQTSGSPLDEQTLVRELGQRMVAQQQARVAGGGPATAQQAATMAREKQLRDVAAFRPEEQSVFSALRGLNLEGEQAPTGTIFADLVSRAQDPNKFYQSTLKPKLALLQDQVKARAAQRGILGSGLELENLGRTGSELAIRETDAQEAFRQQQLANFQGLYNVGQGLRNREIGLEGDLVNIQLGRESRLTDLLNQNTNFRLDDMVRLLERQTGQATAGRLDAEDAAAAKKAALGQAAGTVGGFVLGGAPGALFGSAALGGGGGGGSDVSSLLGSSRQPDVTGLQTDASGVTSLTRQPSQPSGGIDIDALLKLLQAGSLS